MTDQNSRKLSSNSVLRMLTSDWKLLSDAIEKKPEETTYPEFVSDFTPFERFHFMTVGPYQDLVRRLVLCRFQLRVAATFTPRMKKEPERFYPIFLPLMSELVDRAHKLEEEFDEVSKKAIEAKEEDLRRDLNASSNGLFSAKMSFFSLATDQLSTRGIDPEEKILDQIRSEMDQYRAFKKEARQEGLPQALKEPKPDRTKPTFLSGGLVWIVMSSVLLGGGSWWAYSRFFRPNPFGLSSPVITFKLTKIGVIVETFSDKWDGLKQNQKLSELLLIQKYLEGKKLRQARLLDEKGRLLGIVFSAKTNGLIDYRRELYR